LDPQGFKIYPAFKDAWEFQGSLERAQRVTVDPAVIHV
jgi:hypothetical protein